MRISKLDVPLKTICLALWMVVILTPAAEAYIGPGAGISMLGALLGVAFAVLLAIGGVLYLPVRAVMKRRKAQSTGDGAADPDSDPSGQPPTGTTGT